MQHVEPLLLNFDHKIDIPGDYSVEAERHLSSALAAHYFSPDTPKEILDVHTTLYFRVGASASLNPKSLQIFMAQLKSDDSDKRSEAARTLASVEPQFLEDVADVRGHPRIPAIRTTSLLSIQCKERLGGL